MPDAHYGSQGIRWNEVTWYSRLGALVLFLAVIPALFFYIGEQYEATTSLRAPLIASSTLPSSASGLVQAYLNPEYNFTIQYPSNKAPCTGGWSDFLSTNNGAMRFCSTPLEGKFNTALLTIGVSSNAQDIVSCLVTPPSEESQITDMGTTTINGVAFHEILADSPGAGQSSASYFYRSILTGYCVNIEETISGPDPSQMNSAQGVAAQADYKDIKSQLDNAVESFRLLPVQ